MSAILLGIIAFALIFIWAHLGRIAHSLAVLARIAADRHGSRHS